uniref:Peptide chain release factor 1 n=1 Tax=Ammonifex degensii TaxID=42838 RepID=A0A7C1FFB8_9THEO
MLQKLDKIEERYEELSQKIADPEVIADYNRWREYVKAHAEMEEVVHTYRKFKRVCRDIEEAELLLREEKDPELRDLASEELASLKEQKEALARQLKMLLLPKDPNDEKNVILEIRAGTGGEEAALFAADLLRMYLKFAERLGWRTELLSSNPTDLGGFKEVIVLIEGRGSYSRLKFESGVHRVQRVPETEASGRIHTSAATVAVLPEAEEVDVAIDPKDLRIDVFCSTGPGGQSVNTTQSAVRITHLPTGIVVSCQDEKSQHKNKEKAMKVLRARLLDKMQREQQEAIAAARRSQVGTGDRSERIRTYNFPQNRVTDHRIGLTLYRLEEVLEGDLDELITALIAHYQAERLRQIS